MMGTVELTNKVVLVNTDTTSVIVLAITIVLVQTNKRLTVVNKPLTIIVRTDLTALNQATTRVMANELVSLVNVIIAVCSLIFQNQSCHHI